MLKSFILVFSCCVLLCNSECGLNEVNNCVTSCPPEKTCRNRDETINCLDSIENCYDKCVCKEGYFRNDEGKCTSDENCDKVCTGANEYFACGNWCDNICFSLHLQNKTNCPFERYGCRRMCYCEDGFARDDNGNCIPIQKCPQYCSGEHEVYTECKKSCPPETCNAIVARFKCDSKETCKLGCVCKKSYYRKDEGSPCIPLCQCPEMKHSQDCKAHPT